MHFRTLSGKAARAAALGASAASRAATEGTGPGCDHVQRREAIGGRASRTMHGFGAPAGASGRDGASSTTTFDDTCSAPFAAADGDPAPASTCERAGRTPTTGSTDEGASTRCHGARSRCIRPASRSLPRSPSSTRAGLAHVVAADRAEAANRTGSLSGGSVATSADMLLAGGARPSRLTAPRRQSPTRGLAGARRAGRDYGER